MFLEDIKMNDSFDDVTIGRGGHVKSVCLDGVEFEVHRYTKARPIRTLDVMLYVGDMQKAWRPLRECYQRPSKRKQGIYADWCDWTERNGAMVYGVSSYNAHHFSFSALLRDERRGLYAIVYVTHAHNYITLFDDYDKYEGAYATRH